MSQKLQVRRGTDSQRQSKIFDSGELIWTTDTKQLFVGDGSTTGGISVLNFLSAQINNILSGLVSFSKAVIDNITIDGNTITSSQGDINISPNNGQNVNIQSTRSVFTSRDNQGINWISSKFSDGQNNCIVIGTNACGINPIACIASHNHNMDEWKPLFLNCDDNNHGSSVYLKNISFTDSTINSISGDISITPAGYEVNTTKKWVSKKDQAISNTLYTESNYEARTSPSPGSNIVPAYGYHIPNIIGAATYITHSGELRFISSSNIDERILKASNLAAFNNKIYSTYTNANLELEANGIGVIDLKSPAYTSNKANLDTLISKTKGEILDCILGLSAQNNYSDIRLCHIFDNNSGSSMTDKLNTGNNLILSTPSSNSTAGIIGTCPYDSFNNARYWQASNNNSLSFGDGSNDSDFSILVAGIPTSISAETNFLLGKWDANTAYTQEYFLDIGYAARQLNFMKGDASSGGYIRIRETIDRTPDIGSFHVYCATATGTSYYGMDIYVDGIKCTNVVNSSYGTYTAMENGVCNIGPYYSISGINYTPSIPNFKYSLILIIAKKLTDKEVRKISTLLLGIAGRL